MYIYVRLHHGCRVYPMDLNQLLHQKRPFALALQNQSPHLNLHFPTCPALCRTGLCWVCFFFFGGGKGTRKRVPNPLSIAMTNFHPNHQHLSPESTTARWDIICVETPGCRGCVFFDAKLDQNLGSTKDLQEAMEEHQETVEKNQIQYQITSNHRKVPPHNMHLVIWMVSVMCVWSIWGK